MILYIDRVCLLTFKTFRSDILKGLCENLKETLTEQ